MEGTQKNSFAKFSHASLNLVMTNRLPMLVGAAAQKLQRQQRKGAEHGSGTHASTTESDREEREKSWWRQQLAVKLVPITMRKQAIANQ